MKKMIVVMVVALAAMPVCFAGIQAGKDELQAQGSLQNMSGDVDYRMISAQVIYSHFVRDDLSVGGALRVDMSDPGDDASTSIFMLGRGDYYFAAIEDFVPYAGAHLGLISYDYGDDSATKPALGLQGGVKYFISENVSWNAELDLSLYSGVTLTSLLIGLSYYF